MGTARLSTALLRLGAASAAVFLFAGGGCSSDDDSGGSGGADASAGASGSGGSGGSGATGGAGATGGSGGASGSGGCPTAPGDCDTCQDEDHASCACAAEESACFGDADCTQIATCAYEGGTGLPGPCLDLDATGAACALACADLFPSGKQKFLAYENCVYCQYCASACGGQEYCTALNAGGSGGSAGSAGSAGASSDAATD
jgi:pilus assembly protein FimV